MYKKIKNNDQVRRETSGSHSMLPQANYSLNPSDNNLVSRIIKTELSK